MRYLVRCVSPGDASVTELQLVGESTDSVALLAHKRGLTVLSVRVNNPIKAWMQALTPSPQIITHIVADKETLKEIAEFYEVNEENIKEWNSIKETTEVKTGVKLIIKVEKNLKRGN